jgi:hypothetical protein
VVPSPQVPKRSWIRVGSDKEELDQISRRPCPQASPCSMDAMDINEEAITDIVEVIGIGLMMIATTLYTQEYISKESYHMLALTREV